MVQSAEKGAYPEVMCATEEGLPQDAYYGPTGRMNWVGPVGACDMEPFVLDRDIARRLWEVSEAETGCQWDLPVGKPGSIRRAASQGTGNLQTTNKV